MTEAPGGSAGFGHGSDPEEHEALLRRIREFLRHGAAAEAGVEEWGEFAAQLRFLREELPPEERAALLQRWDRVLLRALPDLQLPTDQRDNLLLALEAAAAEGAAWAALEDRAPPEQPSGVAPVLRPSVWTLDWESAAGGEEEPEHREDEALVLTAAGGRGAACSTRSVLAPAFSCEDNAPANKPNWESSSRRHPRPEARHIRRSGGTVAPSPRLWRLRPPGRARTAADPGL